MTTTSFPEELQSRLNSADDLDLLERVGLGDEAAMASIYDRHSTLVYSVALRVCQDSASAENVVENVFMQIWAAPLQFASAPGRLDGKLGLLSRNLAVEGMTRLRLLESSQQPSVGCYNHHVNRAKISRLLQAPEAMVAVLPDLERQILEMAFFDAKTSFEIAEETGIALGTIGSTLVSALSAMRGANADAMDVVEETGLEVLDLDSNKEFAARILHTRDITMQMEGLRRLTHSFVQSPDTILQELVNAAVDLCGADSAGISLETEEKSDETYYRWVATAGQYSGFLNAVLPRYPSACSICLERAKPQLFRVRQRFFDIMAIQAPLVTDGILLPWQVGETRGTIFIMAHGRTAAFDKDDGRLMRVLADFAALAVRHQRQQSALLEQAKATAAAAMANKLAHRINNPLQCLTNVAYLAAEGQSNYNAVTLGQEFSADLRRLSAVVIESLTLRAETIPSQL